MGQQIRRKLSPKVITIYSKRLYFERGVYQYRRLKKEGVYCKFEKGHIVKGRIVKGWIVKGRIVGVVYS